MNPAEHDQVTLIDGFHVAAIDGEGLCIVDEAGHYWRFVSHNRIQGKGDRLAEAYRNVR